MTLMSILRFAIVDHVDRAFHAEFAAPTGYDERTAIDVLTILSDAEFDLEVRIVFIGVEEPEVDDAAPWQLLIYVVTPLIVPVRPYGYQRGLFISRLAITKAESNDVHGKEVQADLQRLRRIGSDFGHGDLRELLRNGKNAHARFRR
jgi:hypothetical protein